MPHKVKPILAGRQKNLVCWGVSGFFQTHTDTKTSYSGYNVLCPPPPAPAKHREVQVSVFEPVLKWTTLHRVLKEEEVDFKGVCCSYGNYFCGGGIVLRLYNPLFNVI